MKGYRLKKVFMHAGCPHFMTVRRIMLHVRRTGSLLYSRVETVLASEIADGDLKAVTNFRPKTAHAVRVSRITVRRLFRIL